MHRMVLVVPGCKVEPPARVCSTKVHLTYSGLWPGELTHADILSEARSWAQTRHGLREYLIGCEKHVDPTIPGRDEHYHVYLHFGKAVDLPNWQRATSFDMHGRGGRCLSEGVVIKVFGPGPRRRQSRRHRHRTPVVVANTLRA